MSSVNPFASRQRVSLAQLTVSGSTPLEVVRAAAAAEFDAVGLRLEARLDDERQGPEAAGDRVALARIVAECAATGMAVSNVTGRYLVPGTTRDDIARLVDAGAALGSRYVVAVSRDPDESRATANLALVGELASASGMGVALEFITYNFVSTLEQADRVAAATGNPKVGLMVDALHLSRSGGAPGDLATTRSPVHVVQLCDAAGPRPNTVDERIRESRTARLYPGQGDLELRALIAASPADCDLEVEAPHPDHLGLDAVARARFAAQATRGFLSEAFAQPNSTGSQTSRIAEKRNRKWRF